MDPTAVGTSSNHLIAIGIACVVGCSISIVSVRPTAAGASVCIAVVGTVTVVAAVAGVGTSAVAVSVIASTVLTRFIAVGAAFACVAIVSAVGTGVVLTGSAVGTRIVGTVVLVNPAIHVSIDVASCHYCCRPRYQLRTQSSTSAQCLIVGLGRRRHRCQLCMWSSTSA